MRKLLVHILLFVVWTNANCQNQPQALPTLIPQSPDVYSLSKFEETPVSHFSGVPNISIPIYNFKNRDISIPIGLNYHSGGIKVDEIASSIGLGWSMNVGGHITRVLKGLPDEESYLKTSDKVTDYINLINNGNHEETIRLMSKVKKDKTLDYQPDEFVYNFMGYSGKFVFNQDRSDENPYGEIVMLPESDVKIDFEIEGTRIINWEITIPNGVKYFFGVNCYSSFESEGGAELLTSTQNISTNSGGHDTYNTLLCFTSWYLKEIRLINNQTIKFNYNVDNFGRASFNSETRRLQPNDHFSTKSYSSSYGKTSRIKSIEGINGKVEFNYSDRQDSYEKKLESIEIKNNFNDLISRIDLIHSYFTTMDSNKQGFIYSDNFLSNYIPTDEHLQKRLKLEEVKFLDKNLNNNTSYSYRLEYYEDYELPNRYSYAQDIWGYYNGQSASSSTSTFLPRIFSSYTDEGGNSQTVFNMENKNREISDEHIKTGALKKIFYPEGGSQEFIFECNKKRVELDKLLGLRDIFNIPSDKGGKSVVNERDNLVRRGFNTQHKIYYYNYSSSNFTIPEEISDNGLVNMNYTNRVTGNIGNGIYEIRFELIKISSSTNEEVIYSALLTDHDLRRTMNLEPGEYKLNLNILAKYYNEMSDFAEVSINWKQNRPNLYDIKMGGLRIKSINTYNSNGELELTKEYEYPISLNDKLYQLPVFSQQIKYTNENSNVTNPPRLSGVRIMSHSAHPLQSVNGKSYGYDIVKEKKISINNPEKSIETTFEFTYNQGSLDQNTHLKGLVPTAYDWMYGSTKRIISSIKDEFNSYAPSKHPNIFFPEKIAHGINTDLYPTDGPSDLAILSVEGNHTHNTPFYTYQSGHMQLDKQKSTHFFENNDVINETTFYYETNSLNPTKIETDIGNSNIITTHNYYANTQQEIPELDSDSKNNLEVLNRKELIKTKVFKNGVKVSNQVNDFKVFNSIAYRNKIKTSKGNLSFEEQIVFHEYDSEGNLIEVSKKDGAHIVYIWGYNGTQPIAKIENATLSDIPNSTIINLKNLSNSDNDNTLYYEGNEGALRNALDSLRAFLPNAQVTTFTYDPLVGVTSITDIRGKAVYYKYDDFNRLHLIKDADGNILKENTYNYKNK